MGLLRNKFLRKINFHEKSINMTQAVAADSQSHFLVSINRSFTIKTTNVLDLFRFIVDNFSSIRTKTKLQIFSPALRRMKPK